MNREILQQALHHLVDLADDLRRIPSDIAQTIAALEAELAKPEQEPQMIQIKDGQLSYIKKPWVGLTDEDCIEAQKNSWNEYKNGKEFKFDGFKLCKNIEQILKEKNT